MSNPPVRVQLVDDHEVVCAGFRHLLEHEGNMQVVAESPNGKQACKDFETHRPDILVMDISLPDISGLEVLRRILGDHADARVVMLSMHVGMVAERAMQLGARGFVCKRSGASALVSAIRSIMRGGRYLDPAAEVQQAMSAQQASMLSKRELEVCILLAQGKSVSDIARLIHLSEKTVYTHRQHIMDKLGVSTAIELAQVATRMGILSNG